MFRKRRRPTPNFKIPPAYNPLDGQYSNLQQVGTSAYGSVMQVAAEDIYEDYVICRGFDPRIMKFIDYGDGAPGISCAKPFGLRGNRNFKIGELFPAFLPIQGIITYTSPSPADIDWRLGQNPGTTGSTENGGHPSELSDGIDLLYDHNGKAINWMLIVSDPGGVGKVQGYLTSLEDGEGCFTGLKKAVVLVKYASCGLENLLDTLVDVYDCSNEGSANCIFDHPFEDLEDVWVWATSNTTSKNAFYDPNETIPDPENPEGPEIPNPDYNPEEFCPCHFAADDRCCVAADSGGGGGGGGGTGGLGLIPGLGV